MRANPLESRFAKISGPNKQGGPPRKFAPGKLQKIQAKETK